MDEPAKPTWGYLTAKELHDILTDTRYDTEAYCPYCDVDHLVELRARKKNEGEMISEYLCPVTSETFEESIQYD